jgi:hypothetical protein
MKTTLEMAREAGFTPTRQEPLFIEMLERFANLARADERNSWPAEMKAMERQVNILTDALAQEREACAKVCEELAEKEWADNERCAAAIRARSNT